MTEPSVRLSRAIFPIDSKNYKILFTLRVKIPRFSTLPRPIFGPDFFFILGSFATLSPSKTRIPYSILPKYIKKDFQ